MRTKTRVSKKRFDQPEFDKLVTRKARAILALRKAREELVEYNRTHTSGIARKRKGETWI